MGDPREYEGDYNSDDEERLPEPNEDELEEDDEGRARELAEEEPEVLPGSDEDEDDDV